MNDLLFLLLTNILFSLAFTYKILLADFKATLRGWVNLRLNFRLEGYVSHQCLWTVRWGNGYSTTLPLEVFTQRNFALDLIWLKLNVFKKQKMLFEHPFGGLRSNVHTPAIARWKAFGRLPIHHSWSFFAISYGWDIRSGNLSKSAFSYHASSYANVVSCLSICHTCALRQNQIVHCGYFDAIQKGSHSAFLTPTVVSRWRCLPSEICTEKRRLR